MMWLALGIALTPVSVLFWVGLTACDGARMMFVMPCLSERDEDQASNQNTPLARPLTQTGAVVGDRGDINLYHGTDLHA